MEFFGVGFVSADEQGKRTSKASERTGLCRFYFWCEKKESHVFLPTESDDAEIDGLMFYFNFYLQSE